MRDHPLFAAVYDRAMAPVEHAGLGEHRRRLLAAAKGRVLELGAGTGANLRWYSGVESVTVLEPDAAMRRHLLARLAEATVPVEVLGDALPTAFDDGAFDTVVTTLVLCTVPDPARTLAEIRRVLAPGGAFLFLEHIRAPGWTGRVQRVARPLWAVAAAGCHPDRDTVGAITAAGFSIDDLERFRMPNVPPIVRPAVQGVAR
jgi:SAM-dependent methyltransferase